jgi:hypothetical protein
MMKPTKKCIRKLFAGELDIRDVEQGCEDDTLSGKIVMDEITVERCGDTTTVCLQFKGDTLFKFSADNDNGISISDIEILMNVTFEV